MQPLVSIIIPTHRPSHFRTALRCAQNQTYARCEIIVSDNSGDSEISDLCAQFPQVIYRKNEDGAPSSNIALPISLANGEYVKYLFDDDLIYPHCIDSMVGWVKKSVEAGYDNVGLITSSRHAIDADNLCIHEFRHAQIASPSALDGNQVLKQMLIFQDNFIGEFSTVMFKRSLIDCDQPMSIFSLFGEEFTSGLIDVPLYISILRQSSLLYIPYSLSAFRQHAMGGSNAQTNPNLHYAVSDWFRMTRGAFEAGLLSTEEASASVVNYMNRSRQFIGKFPEELSVWERVATVFAQGL